MRAGRRQAYLHHLVASIAGGTVALALLWSSLFGDALSGSSTAALIFAVVPFYAAAAQASVYGAFRLMAGPATKPGVVSLLGRSALLVPFALFAVLMFGLFQTSFDGNESKLAQHSSEPKTLERLFEQSRTGQADAFGVPLFIAQNPDAPGALLGKIAGHEHPAVRAHVARNPATPRAVVAALRNDCAAFVRKIAVERLGPDDAVQGDAARSGICPPSHPN
jgi:hypothetical protein